MVVGGERKGGLIGEMVEIAGGVGTVGDSDCGIANQELLGLAPAGNGTFRGSQGHCDRLGAGRTVLDGLEEATGAFGGMRRAEWAGCDESERVPELNHLEIATAQGLDGGNGAVHPLLE